MIHITLTTTCTCIQMPSVFLQSWIYRQCHVHVHVHVHFSPVGLCCTFNLMLIHVYIALCFALCCVGLSSTRKMVTCSLPPFLPPSLLPSLPPSLPSSLLLSSPPSLPPSLLPSLHPFLPPSLLPSPHLSQGGTGYAGSGVELKATNAGAAMMV